jgi:site-specific DNA recombinase
MTDYSNDNKKYEGVKAFLISRVSDPRQADALPAQEYRLDEYSKRLKLNAEKHMFDETAYKEDRTKFLEIINNATQHKGFYIFVFDKIDRLTRDVSSQVVMDLKKLVKEGKTELHFPSDGLVFHQKSPAHDKTRLDMGMVFGGYYSAAISDNVKRKIEQKLRDGEYPGKACIGYMNIQWEVDKKVFKDIVPDPERQQYIVKAFELRLAGNSFRTIAKILKEDGLRSNTKHLKPVGQSQIETMLKRTFYYGVMKYDGATYPHKYKPIITKELFDLVQKVNDDRNTDDHSKTDIKQTFTFSGILKCATCGCSISSYTKKGHVYMRCTKAKVNVPCNQPHVAEADLLPQVTELLNKLAVSQSTVNQVLTLLKDEHDNIVLFYDNAIKQTRAEYTKLDKRLATLYDDRLVGRITVDEYDKYVQTTKTEMEQLDAKLVELTNGNKSFIVTAEYLLELASKAKYLFESSQPAQKNKILRAILANLNLNQKKLQLNLLQPFSVLLSDLKTNSWLRLLGSNQRHPR